jgi:transcriptional antiterminator RfaH
MRRGKLTWVACLLRIRGNTQFMLPVKARFLKGVVVPILAAEQSIFPLDLFRTLERPVDDNSWWALHTRPRTEKALARRLLRREVSFFLPVYRQDNTGHRRPQASLPLFPGYLFLHGPRESCGVALDSGFVANCLQVIDQAELTDNLRDIYRLIETGQPLSRVDAPAPGTKVRIISGPMSGIEGVVIRSGKALKLIVQVHFLQNGAAVEVDGSMIERV